MITKGLDGYHVYALMQWSGGPFKTREAAQEFMASPKFQKRYKELKEEEDDQASRVVWISSDGGGSFSSSSPAPDLGSSFINPETGDQFIDPQTGNSFISN